MSENNIINDDDFAILEEELEEDSIPWEVDFFEVDDDLGIDNDIFGDLFFEEF